ncbi:hypothetical protein C8J57DRAFT_1594195 [Mycena rebaudengoi]|nr:hypothetical protein C8J57DRAFT_1594195 [Mycena rebaudengoi]
MSGLPVPTPPINVKSVEPCFDPPMLSSSHLGVNVSYSSIFILSLGLESGVCPAARQPLVPQIHHKSPSNHALVLQIHHKSPSNHGMRQIRARIPQRLDITAASRMLIATIFPRDWAPSHASSNRDSSEFRRIQVNQTGTLAGCVTVVDCILRLNIFKYTFESASLIQDHAHYCLIELSSSVLTGCSSNQRPSSIVRKFFIKTTSNSLGFN